MSYKMKGFSGFGNSPAKKSFDYSKKNDYSKKATKDNFGSKLAKSMVPDISTKNTAWDNIKEAATHFVPMSKGLKLAKYAYKYMTRESNSIDKAKQTVKTASNSRVANKS